MAMAGAVTPLMLIPLLGIGVIYSQTMSRFRPAARKTSSYLKRCESMSRSPIYTQFAEGKCELIYFPFLLFVIKMRNDTIVFISR